MSKGRPEKGLAITFWQWWGVRFQDARRLHSTPKSYIRENRAVHNSTKLRVRFVEQISDGESPCHDAQYDDTNAIMDRGPGDRCTHSKRYTVGCYSMAYTKGVMPYSNKPTHIYHLSVFWSRAVLYVSNLCRAILDARSGQCMFIWYTNIW